MHSVILLLPNSLLYLLPVLQQVLGLNNIQLSVALGADAECATHAAGYFWNAQPLDADFSGENLD